MKIKILPDEVASQIAAGEVIERPASVVKECIENALDAEADEIEITVEGAGTKLIEVADNGMGIASDELDLTVVRHATSKLASADDLFKIETLGFRGEALASIGSVSHLRITSRSRDEQVGSSIKVSGGEVTGKEKVGTPRGTIVRVENLFFNVPARLKFLKTDRTESRHIKDTVVQYALAYPEVRFSLVSGGRKAFATTGSGDPREVLLAVYGLEVGKQMIEVFAGESGVEIGGFISPPDLTRSNRGEIRFFVNRRPVQDIALTKALTQGYHRLLMKGRYPLAVLFLELDPDRVDVNVHPTKAEVRFRDKGEIFRAVEGAVRRALLANTPVPEVGGFQGSRLWAGDQDRFPSRPQPGRAAARAWPAPAAESGEHGPGREGDPQREQPLREFQAPILRLIGQVAATYLIAEGPDGLYLVDQHAAHERVLFEKFLEQREESPATQSLLEAVTVEFPPASADLLEEHLELLRELGFEIEGFGQNTFVVRGLPALVSGTEPGAAVRAVVEDLEVDETPLEKDLEEKIIARVCKKAAVKAGQVLDPEEQQALLRDLEACRSPRTCPHGRPTMIHLSVDLLERKFGRTGPR
jgi:DNA mismatch repair protein MutL